MHARPHPGPLPRGEGNPADASCEAEGLVASRAVRPAVENTRSLTRAPAFCPSRLRVSLSWGRGQGEGERIFHLFREPQTPPRAPYPIRFMGTERVR